MIAKDGGYSPPLTRRFQAVAIGPPVVLFLGTTLLIRVLSDDMSAANSRHSGSLNLSGVIAALFILVAVGLGLRRRRSLAPTILAAVWLCIWTAVAVVHRGASTETLREGVREGSILAVGVIVYNARGAVTVAIATRLVQLIGVIPALLALAQLATDTGMRVAGNIRSNGTFAHPNSAAVFFAIAATVSLWRYLDRGRGRSDLILLLVFAAGLVATYSIDGLGTLAVMLTVLGLLRPGSLKDKLLPCLLAAAVVAAFFATPLGTSRVAKESSTNFSSAERDEANSTLSWRLYKWKTLLPAWERSPVVGQGLGTTVTEEGEVANEFAGDLPHNEYVRYLVETGVIGLAILLSALAILIRSLVRRRGVSGSPGANGASLALAIVAGSLVNATADNTLLYSAASYAVALIIAAVLISPALGSRAAPTLRTM
jgi:O-antigen ligase